MVPCDHYQFYSELLQWNPDNLCRSPYLAWWYRLRAASTILRPSQMQ